MEPAQSFVSCSSIPYELPRKPPPPPSRYEHYDQRRPGGSQKAASWRQGGIYDFNFDADHIEAHTHMETFITVSSRAASLTEPPDCDIVLDAYGTPEELQPIICAEIVPEPLDQPSSLPLPINRAQQDRQSIPLADAESLTPREGTRDSSIGELGKRRGFKGTPLLPTTGRKSFFLSLPDALSPRTPGSKSSSPKSPLTNVTNLLTPTSATAPSRISKESEVSDELQALFNQYDPFGCSSNSFYTPYAYTRVPTGNTSEMNDFSIYAHQEPVKRHNSGKRKSNVRQSTFKDKTTRITMRTTIYDMSVYDALLPISHVAPASPKKNAPSRAKHGTPTRQVDTRAEDKKQKALEIVFTPPSDPQSPKPPAVVLVSPTRALAKHNTLNTDKTARIFQAAALNGTQAPESGYDETLFDSYYGGDDAPEILASTPVWERPDATPSKLALKERGNHVPFSAWSPEDNSLSEITVSTADTSSERSSSGSMPPPTPPQSVPEVSQARTATATKIGAIAMSSYTFSPTMTNCGEEIAYHHPSRPVPAAIKPPQGARAGPGNGRIKYRSAPILVRAPLPLSSGMNSYAVDDEDPFLLIDRGVVAGNKGSPAQSSSVSDSSIMEDNGNAVGGNCVGRDIKRGRVGADGLGIGVMRDSGVDNRRKSFVLGEDHSAGTADDTVPFSEPGNSLKGLRETRVEHGCGGGNEAYRRRGESHDNNARSTNQRKPEDLANADHKPRIGNLAELHCHHSVVKGGRVQQQRSERDGTATGLQPAFDDDGTCLFGKPAGNYQAHSKPLSERPILRHSKSTESRSADASTLLSSTDAASTRRGISSGIRETRGRKGELDTRVGHDGAKMGTSAGVDASLMSADGHDVDGSGYHSGQLSQVDCDGGSSNSGGRSEGASRVAIVSANASAIVVGNAAMEAKVAGVGYSSTATAMELKMKEIGMKRSRSAESDGNGAAARQKGSGNVVGRLVQNWEGKTSDKTVNGSTRIQAVSIGSENRKNKFAIV
ncbi:hypothetical protein AX16_004451 [Volvariella volvacea WC 439]|nr:hypothetical protein AX16_004451 [Volvariella volvacea WC 439]